MPFVRHQGRSRAQHLRRTFLPAAFSELVFISGFLWALHLNLCAVSLILSWCCIKYRSSVFSHSSLGTVRGNSEALAVYDYQGNWSDGPVEWTFKHPTLTTLKHLFGILKKNQANINHLIERSNSLRHHVSRILCVRTITICRLWRFWVQG